MVAILAFTLFVCPSRAPRTIRPAYREGLDLVRAAWKHHRPRRPALTPWHPLLEQDIRVYASTAKRYEAFRDDDLVLHETAFVFRHGSPQREIEVSVAIPSSVQRNGTMHAHIYMTPLGVSPVPTDPTYDPGLIVYTRQALVVFGERPIFAPLRNLLTGERPPWQQTLIDAGVPLDSTAWISFWKPTLSINVVVDAEAYSSNAVPEVLVQYWKMQRLVNETTSRYKPIVFVNDLTVVKGHFVPLNESVQEAALKVDVRPMSIHRFVWMLKLRQSFASQEQALGLSEKESEDLRSMFVDTPPALLYTTVVVSALHLLFDVLAFRSDVAFWTSVETMDGLSTRSVLANVAMEVVILVYLLDEGASWLVQVTSLLSLVVGVFKIFKSLRVRAADAARAGTKETLTDTYDKAAYRLLLPPLAAVVIGYSSYELVFDYHKGWWAWALNSAVALVYGVGFIVMTPQLFINYKLKSVAHLPWNYFCLKALNTFIDDCFAFCIRMPALHRMSVFRDDIVFVCFLYQRWIYPVDRSRVNEFGHRGDDGDRADSVPSTVANNAQPVKADLRKRPHAKKAD